MAAGYDWTEGGTNWTGSPYGHDYRWPSWDRDTIVRYYWFDTLFVPYWSYWGWWREPTVTGTPPYDWPGSRVGGAVESADEDEDGGLAVQRVGDYGVDLDGDGRFDQLVVEIEVGAARAGGVVAMAVVQADLVEGGNRVSLPFDGLHISAGKADGPYALKYLSVTDEEDPEPDAFANSALARWDSLYTTAAYRADEFENWGAMLTDRIVERGLDDDGDGRYEALTLEIGLDVFEPGVYRVEGDLYDVQEHLVARATWTGTGTAASLHFDALSGTTGPYTLQDLRLFNDEGSLIDSVIGAYSTQQVVQAEGGTRIVDQMSLDGPALRDILPTGYADAGVDRDGDGLYDWLAVGVPVEVEETGWYVVEAWLEGSDGTLVSWAGGEMVNLVGGTHALTLTFSGPAIHAHAADGPFTLAAVKLLDDDREVLDVVNVAYTTAPYTHDQFEALPYFPAGHRVLFEDHVEDGGGDWTADPPWAIADARYRSPTHAWTDSPGENYANDQDVSLATGPVDTQDLRDLTLEFQTCYDLETDYDYGYVEVLADGAITWTRVATYTGQTVQWSRETLDLSVPDGGDTLQVRFRLDTDRGLAADGWYVDDIAVYTMQEVQPVAAFASSSPDIVGQVTRFRNASSGGNLSYAWSFGDGTPIVETINPTHTYVTTGTFTVVLTATNSVGSDVAVQDVVIQDPPPEPPLLQGFWKLEETAGQRLDSSGMGNHLAEHNGVGSAAGKVNLAADLESDEAHYLSIDDEAHLGLDIEGSLTLVGWASPESLERWQVLAAKYEYGEVEDRAYRLDLRPGNLVGFVVSPDGEFSNSYLLEADPGFALQTGEWYHVAAVFDADARTMSLYVDGTLIGARTVSHGSIHDSSAPFVLGADTRDGQAVHHFDGRLDEWRVYGRALSGEQIVALIDLAKPTPTPTNTPTPTSTPTSTPTPTNTPTPSASPAPPDTPTPSSTPTVAPAPSGADDFHMYLPLIGFIGTSADETRSR